MAMAPVGETHQHGHVMATRPASRPLMLMPTSHFLDLGQTQKTATSAAQASETTPGEALFPVSLLARAKLRSGASELGTCVDAMAGCESGRITYVMASQGGIAGAGETLRRIAWRELQVEADEVVTNLDPAQFCALEAVSKDQWPSR